MAHVCIAVKKVRITVASPRKADDVEWDDFSFGYRGVVERDAEASEKKSVATAAGAEHGKPGLTPAPTAIFFNSNITLADISLAVEFDFPKRPSARRKRRCLPAAAAVAGGGGHHPAGPPWDTLADGRRRTVLGLLDAHGTTRLSRWRRAAFGTRGASPAAVAGLAVRGGFVEISALLARWRRWRIFDTAPPAMTTGGMQANMTRDRSQPFTNATTKPPAKV
uniref:Uncharacterized protein n=1 Tax=Oryza nivara TaxID=4536 RepID=A0A0E0FRQ4_ORYNI